MGFKARGRRQVRSIHGEVEQGEAEVKEEEQDEEEEDIFTRILNWIMRIR